MLRVEITLFTNIRYRTGPKTEPCGTPQITSLTEEKLFSKTTHIQQFFTY